MDSLSRFRDMMSYSLPPGGPLIPARYIINLYKGGMLPSCLYMMQYYNNDQNKNINMLYTVMHGSYGLCWLYKDFTFPDASFMRKVNFTNMWMIAIVLSMYHYIAYMRISHPVQDISDNQAYMALFLYISGVVLMMASDCQKYYTLKYKKGLISEGNLSRTRNPNYLGEMMLYAAFVLMLPNKNRWIGWSIVGFVWITLFNINMMLKDYSFSKKEGWNQYVRRSRRLLPAIFQSNKTVDNVVYLGLAVGFGYLVKKYYI